MSGACLDRARVQLSQVPLGNAAGSGHDRGVHLSRGPDGKADPIAAEPLPLTGNATASLLARGCQHADPPTDWAADERR